MQILVIGGFGYIGSQILQSLSDSREFEGCEVAVVDNWSYGRGMAPVQAYFREKIGNFSSYCIELSDSSSDVLKEVVASSDYIVNAASLTQVPDTYLHEKYILHGAENLAECILASPGRLRKVIDISSTSIYGPVKKKMPEVAEPYGEDVYPDPEIAYHNYASSKLRAETMWQSDKCKDIPFTMFRLSTIFGYAPGMRYNQFIGQFLVDAVAGRETVLPGSPSNYRPFFHVADCAELMLHLLTEDSHANGHVINIGSAHLNPRLGDLFAGLAAMLKKDFAIEAEYKFACEIGTPPFEEDYRVDFSKFEQMISFTPRHLGFEEGARELVERILG